MVDAEFFRILEWDEVEVVEHDGLKWQPRGRTMRDGGGGQVDKELARVAEKAIEVMAAE